MILKFGGQKIEIKAKGIYNENKYNKQDTEAFVNMLSIWAGEAAKYHRLEGFSALEEEAQNFADYTFHVLKDLGVYDKCK